MIFGNCPYPDCNDDFTVNLSEGMPIQQMTCEKCKRVSWLLHSRLDPKSWTDESFREIADIDEETHKITFKDKTKSVYDQ